MLLGNYQIVVYLIMALLASGFLYKGYSIIQQNATNKVVIEQLQRINQSQQDAITNLQMENALNQYIILERDQKISELSNQFEPLVVDLGVGSNDVAPPAIRQYLKNLRDQYK